MFNHGKPKKLLEFIIFVAFHWIKLFPRRIENVTLIDVIYDSEDTSTMNIFVHLFY